MMSHALTPSVPASNGARVVATDGRPLALLHTHLQVRAGAGMAQVVLRQTFRNPFGESLAVRYQVPLPHDGAVGGFSFELDGHRIEGEVAGREEARAQYEEALVEGRTAALFEQERGSLFNQEVGNIPPGATLVAELRVDHALIWLSEGRWQWRFPTVVAPRYLGAPGRVTDADRVTTDVSLGSTSPTVRFELRVTDAIEGAPSSSGHAIVVHQSGPVTRIGLADEDGAVLDRDVAIDWGVLAEAPSATLRTHRPDDPDLGADAYGLLTLTPPRRPGPAVSRDLILLLDVSGSMGGAPLAQLKRVSLALIDSLRPDDSLAMIAFAMQPVSFRATAALAAPTLKREARAWVEGLQAGGGTEMRRGIIEALTPLRGDGQRQVVLMSDGLIGFESEVIGTILERLPGGSRVHCLGVGSAVNRSLTQAAARAGRGIEVIVGVDEDAERAAQRLVAATAAPQVVGLEVTGTALREVAPARTPDLFAGAPALLSLRLAPDGGTLELRGQTPEGPFHQSLKVAPMSRGEGDAEVRRRFAREWVEDRELSRARGENVDAAVEACGLRHRIATRLTSWVAVSKEATVDPTSASRRQVIPQALPHGMSAAGLGLRAPASFGAAVASAPAAYAFSPRAAGGPPPGFAPPPPAAPAPARTRGAAPPAPKKMKGRAMEMPKRERAELEGQGAFDGFSQGAHDMEEADDMEETPTMTLRGRIVLDRDGRLIVEVVAPFAIDWTPDASGGLETDGTTFGVTIETDHSTRGRVEAGQVLRLALTRPSSGQPLRLHVASGGKDWVIELR